MSEAIAITSAERQEHAVKLAPIVPDSKLHILRDTIAPSLTPGQLELFVHACERLRLDPFAKQIYAVVRWEWNAEQQRKLPRMTIQTGIDGFRLIAERTGVYAGQGDLEWCGPDGDWTTVWLSDKPPSAARATVYRKGWDKPIRAVARWSAYVQLKQGGEPVAMWQRMGVEQLAKCAETLALRKAFPQELSGVYGDEEMQQADNERVQLPAAATPKPVAKVEPKLEPKPEPKPEPKSEPPPDNAGPRFATIFPDARFAGHPLSVASMDILEDYRVWLGSMLADESRKRLHPKARASLAEVEAEADKRIAADQPDPVTQRLELAANRGGVQDGDTNEQWGFVPELEARP